jgi:hypothetical protein
VNPSPRIPDVSSPFLLSGCSQQNYKDTFEFGDGDPSPPGCHATRTIIGGTINRLDGAPEDRTGQKAGRLCTKKKLELFFIRTNPAAPPKRSDNCDPNNLALFGCLPGYASWTINPTSIGSEVEPPRGDLTDNPTADDLGLMACCEGFFCPENLACMIREYPLLSWLAPNLMQLLY